MKISNILTLAALVLAGLSAPLVRANPVQVAWGPVYTQAGNNGDATLASWASSAITTFNTNGYAGAPLPALPALAFKVDLGGPGPVGYTFGTGVTSITLDLTGYTYVIMSWGGSNLPEGNGTADFLYFINGTNSFTFTNNDPLANGGLSSIHMFGTPPNNTPGVPDSGSTIGLLGVGLIGLAALRRKFAKR